MPSHARVKPLPAASFSAALDAAIRLRAEGRGREALEMCEDLAKAAPQHPDVQHLLGIVMFEAGSHQAALAAIERAIGFAPERADFLNSRGIICRALGDRARAIEAFRAALERAPELAEAHNNLGAMLLDTGDEAGAITAFRSALKTQPDYADATLNLARVLAGAAGSQSEALDLFRRLLDHRLHQRAAFDGAIELANRMDPAGLPGWLYELVAAHLESGRIVSRSLEALAWRLVVARQGRGQISPDDPLLLAVLARCLAASPEAERLVETLRSRALEIARDARPFHSGELEPIVALALQAALSGHVQGVLEGETDVVARLRGEIEGRLAAGEAPAPETLALHAVFAPLDRLDGAERLARLPVETWPLSFRRLLRRAVGEPLAERTIAPRIPSLGASDDATSMVVAAQYEAHPYPRWIASETGPRRPLGALLRDHLPAVDVPRQLDGAIDLLIAGCGTGWSVIHAAASYQGARVIGLDLSRASLAYGLREIIARRLDNVVLVQGDILQVGRLGRAFDYIVSGGVLHHMADPLAGWRALVGCLTPHGLLQIGLYSELGRRVIVKARRLIEETAPIGARTSDDEIRAFRRTVLAQGPDGPLAALLRFADFYDLNGCRDLLFNAVEHRFDLVRLQAMLDSLGLEFLGFNLASPEIARAYLSRYADDPLMRSLRNWHQFETENPDTFASMYQFWCRRRATAGGA